MGISIGNRLLGTTGLSPGGGLSRGGGLSFGGFSPSAALNLNFLSGVLDPRITFSRPSLATYFDSTGKLTYAPNNLTLSSQNFSVSPWAAANFTRTTGQSDPFGGTEATLGTFTSNGGSGLSQISLGLPNSRSYIVSIYARLGSWRWFEFTTVLAGATRSWVDMQNGVAGTANHANFSVTLVGGGWYRISAVVVGVNEFFWTPRMANGDAGTATTNNGATFFVFGFQVEAVTYQTTPSTYVATTASAYYGPRFEYDPVTLVPRGLLIEEARTNLVRYSEQFNDAYWVPGSATVAANSVTSPSGTTTADTITSSTGSFAATIASSSISVSASTAYTYSIFLKANVGTNVRLRLSDTVTGQAQVTINLVTGAVSGLAAGPYSSVSASSVNCGNGWWRAILTGTQPAGQTNAIVGLYLENNGDAVYAWGAQLEAGAFATSYLPTGASSVARSADDVSMTGTNFSSWFSATQGTFISNFLVATIGASSPRVIGFNLASGATPMYLDRSTSAVILYNGSANGASATGVFTSSLNKAALGYTDGISNSMALNGGTVGTSGVDYNLGTPTVLYVGSNGTSSYLNGHIASIQYYTSRLSDAQLQALTQPSLEASMFLSFDTTSNSFTDANWGP